MTYRVLTKDRLFKVFCYLPENELKKPGPTVTFSALVNLSAIEKYRAEVPAEERPSYTSFVAKALALTLKEFPYANCRVFENPLGWPWRPRKLVAFQAYDIAFASEQDRPGEEFVAFVDVMRGVDQASLGEIRTWLRQLSNLSEENNKQWRTFMSLLKKIPSLFAAFIVCAPRWSPKFWAKYRGAAALISSPGKYGPDQISAIWAWPLGVSFGRVKPRPLVQDQQLVIKPSFFLTMNFDRRVMAGAPAARFFARLVERLESQEVVKL